MNHYILIYNSKPNKYWDCSRRCMVDNSINFDFLSTKFICTYCKIYENAILISSEKGIFEDLNSSLLTLFKERNEAFLLLKVNPIKHVGYTYQDQFEWIKKFFIKEEKIDDTCMDKSISAFDYSEIK